METIKNYLDNMFAGLPKTARIAELKNNILSNMEDKYNELKSQGKSENEAIGIVISEFGNIDELINELGIQKEIITDSRPLVTEDEVHEYLSVKRKIGLMIGSGVFLCILGPAIMILLNTLFSNGIIANKLVGEAADIPGVIILLVLVTIAVGIFIFSGMRFERYKYMEEGVQLSIGTEAELKRRYDSFLPTFYLLLITGVCLIILSPIAIFITNMMGDNASIYGVIILLIIVAFSVFLFINIGSVKESYERLLNVGDYSTSKRVKSEKDNKVIGAIASIVWPLAVAVFLFCGFVYNLWHIAWIIFPITGILFGMFSAVYSIISDKN